jgi:hypothetical protein
MNTIIEELRNLRWQKWPTGRSVETILFDGFANWYSRKEAAVAVLRHG